MSATVDSLDALKEIGRLHHVKELAADDPKYLLQEMRGFDPTLQEAFSFNMFDVDGDWGWQSLIIDWWMGALTEEGEEKLKEFMGWWDGLDRRSRKFIILKARQLGITWLAVALGLWYILYRPGANVVAYSHGLEEAKLLIGRAWLMYQSLPLVLRDHVQVIYPDRGEIPSDRITIKRKDTGVISTFKALPDTPKAGHGDTVTFGIMDEVARQVYSRGIYTAINPAVSRGGRLVMISTANGVSNIETGEGNFFHNLWYTRRAKNLQAAFLPWNLHPERDEQWYQDEAMPLPHMERNQQYPLNPDNAFILSGDLYFDPDALEFYRGEATRHHTLYRAQFEILPGRGGRLVKVGGGIIEVWAEPRPGGKYGLSGDTASGRSADYSVADVMDLESGEIVASLRGKMDVQAFADQMKCLGRWYGFGDIPARIIPERTGIGEALIGALRNDANGLKPYGNIYQHQRQADIARHISGDYGFPMTSGTRAMVLDKLRSWVKDRKFPFLSEGHVDELSSFIYREQGTSPRAMDGCNDDRVISLALACHLFDLHGAQPTKEFRKRRWRKGQYVPPPTRS